jgi:hypothetical protein
MLQRLRKATIAVIVPRILFMFLKKKSVLDSIFSKKNDIVKITAELQHDANQK